MRYLGLAPFLLFILVGCQDAAPQYPVRTLPAPEGFRGEVRPALGRLSLQYSPHENVALETVITYKETRRGKTETHQETYRFTSSAKRVGKALSWKIDFTEATSPGAKTAQEMTNAELAEALNYSRAGRDGDTAGLPLSRRIRPSGGTRLVAVRGAIVRLRMLTGPKGRLKDIAAEYPGYTSVGGYVREPRPKKNDAHAKFAKQLRKTVFWVFSEGPVGMGDRLYSTNPFTDFMRSFDRAPEWIVAGLTTHTGRPSVLASVADAFTVREAGRDIRVHASGYLVADLETGLVIEGLITVSGGRDESYNFVVEGRWSAAF